MIMSPLLVSYIVNVSAIYSPYAILEFGIEPTVPNLGMPSFISPFPFALPQTLHADLFSGALLSTTSIGFELNVHK